MKLNICMLTGISVAVHASQLYSREARSHPTLQPHLTVVPYLSSIILSANKYILFIIAFYWQCLTENLAAKSVLLYICIHFKLHFSYFLYKSMQKTNVNMSNLICVPFIVLSLILQVTVHFKSNCFIIILNSLVLCIINLTVFSLHVHHCCSGLASKIKVDNKLILRNANLFFHFLTTGNLLWSHSSMAKQT